MNNLLRLVFNKGKRVAALYLLSFCLVFVHPGGATGLKCGLAESSQVDPEIITAMLEAADKGNFYRVDTSISNIEFQVKHFPFSKVEGRFNEFDGGLALPGEAGRSRHILFFIKVNSMVTGDDDLDNYLKSTVFFDAAQFPDIIFVSTGFEWVDATTARLHGELTLRGTTRPLVLNVHISTSDKHSVDQNLKMTLSASAEIQRSEFGMHKLPLLVSDTVRFNFKIEASQVGSQI